MSLLSAAYGTGARLRRTWYARHPERVRRLAHPVISVGNLTVGGSGKTPVVAALATLLRDSGERPVILSRGYARRDRTSPVVVVSDTGSVLEPVERSGDEPQMLARALHGIPVVVGADRHAAGMAAQSRFDVTVFLLDDGFQHVQLRREVDLLVMNAADLAERVLPSGRLREPLHSAGMADAVLVYGDERESQQLARAVGVDTAFTITREYAPLRAVADGAAIDAHPRTVLAVAGIANPARFFGALRALGLDVIDAIEFADHHWFSAADMTRIAEQSRRCRVDMVVTTEKDAMRMMSCPLPDVPMAYLPMRVTMAPAFPAWLSSRLRAGARGR